MVCWSLYCFVNVESIALPMLVSLHKMMLPIFDSIFKIQRIITNKRGVSNTGVYYCCIRHLVAHQVNAPPAVESCTVTAAHTRNPGGNARAGGWAC